MRILSILVKGLAGILMLFLLLILFIRSPWGQNIIKDRVVSYLIEKTDTHIQLDRIYLTFSGGLAIEELLIEDQNQDTLLYSQTLTANIPIWPIVTNQSYDLQHLYWEGARINIHRPESEDFNFQFLIDAFVPTDTTVQSPSENEPASMNLSIGDIHLRNIYARYHDEVGGFDALLNLGNLDLEMGEVDMDSMKFEVENALLENSEVNYHQSKPFPVSTDTSAASLPHLIIGETALHQIKARYHSIPDGINADLYIQDFILEAPVVDLVDNRVHLAKLAMKNSVAKVTTTTESNNLPASDDIESEEFSWPDWKVMLDDLDLQNNSIQYTVNGASVKSGQFNSDAILLDEFTLKGNKIHLNDNRTEGQLNQLGFEEGSGMVVDRIQFNWNVTDDKMEISGLNIAAMENKLQGTINAAYPSFQSLLDQPDQVILDLNLPDIQLNLDPLTQFQPDLFENQYISTLSQRPLSGAVQAQGSLRDFRIGELNINWGTKTALFASGRINNLSDPKTMALALPTILFTTSREDLIMFIPEDSLGMRYPEKSRLTAELSGSLNDLTAIASLQSDLGQIQLEGNFGVWDSVAVNADIHLNELRLDSLLQDPAMGPLTLTASLSTQGQDLYQIDGDFNAVVEEFSWNEYPIRNLSLTGQLNNGQGDIHSSYRDSNIYVIMDGHMVLDSIAPEFEARIQLQEADLEALAVTENDVNMSFDLQAWFRGNASRFEVIASLEDGQLLSEGERIPMGAMDIQAYVTPDSTAGEFNSRMLDISLYSNTSPMGFIDAMTSQVESHLTDSARVVDSIQTSVRVDMKASLRQDPVLSDVFLPGLEEMDSIRVQVDFVESDQILEALVEAPHVIYSGIELDSILLTARSDPQYFGLDLELERIKTGPVTINETRLTNRIEDQVLYTHFLAQYQDRELLQFKTQTTKNDDSIRVHLDPSDLVFDSQPWTVPANNQIVIGSRKIRFENMNITHGDQLFSIDDNPGERDLNIRFERFKLGNIISYFNPDTLLATGILDGRVTLEEPLGDAGLVADLRVDSFYVMEIDMGVLELDGVTEDAQNYSGNLVLKGGEVDLDLQGMYEASEEETEIQLELQIDTISMAAVEYFSGETLINSTGYISGRAEAQGAMTDLRYDGQIYFHEAITTPVLLNTPFGLGTQEIVFNNDGIVLQNFTISDAEDNQFILDGQITTTNIYNPSFDLTMEANRFQILDASAEDNADYYGKASFDATARLTGDLSLPKLDLEIEVGEGTNVTYVMPQGLANLQSREGIVTFVDRKNPIQTTPEEMEEQAFEVRGYEINALISVSDAAVFRVVISEATGDHFEIAGDGDLSFDIDQAGQMTLTGMYTLQSGHYEMNLYNLVNRRFDIAPGSTVSWAGDPFDANMDIRAIYQIETTPAPLMAGQTSGEDLSVQNQYRRRIPFLVYLNLDGQLSEPQLSFDIDMPEDAQGLMGGQVYGQIQRIRQQEQEMNKHVFSLLVLNRFYPTSGNDGSSGGIVNVARDNLNQALADQMNVFSDRLLGDTGFELNFGLESYTDYDGQSPQTKTELDIAAQKNFLNDRLIVNVGSEIDIEGGNTNPQNENPLIGNVSVEYLITENGQLRIRGFRKNVYENVIDGQTIISGLAMTFTKEFNKFHELWMPIITEENDENASEIDE